MKVAIIGGNFIGKGAEAMMNVVTSELQKRLPDISFSLLKTQTHLPERAKVFAEEFRLEYIPTGPRTVLDYILFPVSKLMGTSMRYILQFRRCVHSCIALIDIRGFTFRPDMGIRGANAYFILAKVAKNCGAIHIIMPQVMGPIDGFFRKRIAFHSLMMTENITVRDETTKTILDNIGVTRRKSVGVCPDIAFLFRPSPKCVVRDILSNKGMDSSPYVVITPNIRIYERSVVMSGENKYVTEHVKVIKYIRQKYGYQILLVPHEISKTMRDDSYVIDKILIGLGELSGIYTLTEDYSAADIKAVIGCSEFLLGSRYHSLIAALSMGIPSIAISWSHKYEELMKSVGMAKYSVRHDQFSSDVLYEKIHELIVNRKNLQQQINHAVEGFISKIKDLFDETAISIEIASR